MKNSVWTFAVGIVISLVLLGLCVYIWFTDISVPVKVCYDVLGAGVIYRELKDIYIQMTEKEE